MAKPKSVDTVVDEFIIGFAKKHKQIYAVYQGNLPDRKSPVYFFLKQEKRYDQKLENELTKLDIKLARETDKNLSVIVWPVEPENVADSEYFKTCLYKK